MSEFQLYFTLGYQHILDWQGYDHMVFLLALLAPLTLKEWKKILILITAFTIGHSFSLALATLHIVFVDADFIELLIPISILITAILNITIQKYLGFLHYIITVFFGLIHGMGFSGYLQSLLGSEENLFTPLLSFNLGLELGQIVFTALLLIFIVFLSKYLLVKSKSINLVLSIFSILISVYLIVERI